MYTEKLVNVLLKFLIIIVEDKDDIAEELKDSIRRLLSIDIGSEFVDIICIKNLEEFLNIKLVGDNSKLIFVTDINLGARRRSEGLEIVKQARIKYPGAKLIVHTGYPDFKEECEKELTVYKFIVKDDESCEMISLIVVDLIKGIQNSEFENAKESTMEIVANTDKSFVAKDDNEDNLKIDYLYIRDINEFITAPFNCKISLLEFYLNPFKDRYSYFSVYKKIWSAERLEKLPVEKGNMPSLLLTHKINVKNKIEGFSLYYEGELTVDVSIPSITTLKEEYSSIQKNLNSKNDLITDFLQFFLAKRLVNFYLFGNESDKNFILEMASTLVIGKFVFITDLWEFTTKEKTKDAEFTNIVIEDVSKLMAIDLVDIFYCEIEDKSELENTAKVRVMSLENEKIRFYRTFASSLLNEFGINDQNSKFKMVLFNSTTIPPGSKSFILIPIPPNITS